MYVFILQTIYFRFLKYVQRIKQRVFWLNVVEKVTPHNALEWGSEVSFHISFM